MQEKEIKFTLNNKQVSITTEPTRRLIDVLREEYFLTGVKEGCGEGECGACSVLINGKLSNSCLIALEFVDGADVLTIEGFSETERFNILKNAFSEAGAVQCGFCTPGMIMASEALLRKNSRPTEDDIKLAISGNLCRCTGYNMIISAIKNASKKGDGQW